MYQLSSPNVYYTDDVDVNVVTKKVRKTVKVLDADYSVLSVNIFMGFDDSGIVTYYGIVVVE